MMMTNKMPKGYLIGSIVLVAVGIALALGIFRGQSVATPTLTPSVSDSGYVCAQDAKVCPDGSYVGRQGPKCEFTACPGPVGASQRVVKLYFYNADKDRDASGNVQCSSQGLVAVNRTIAFTNTPIQDAVRTLLAQAPTSQEAKAGLVSELPLAKVQLTGASTQGTLLTLTFTDPDHRTGGGSCFVGILRAQIEATAKQFGGVSAVRLMPTDLFQP